MFNLVSEQQNIEDEGFVIKYENTGCGVKLQHLLQNK